MQARKVVRIFALIERGWTLSFPRTGSAPTRYQVNYDVSRQLSRFSASCSCANKSHPRSRSRKAQLCKVKIERPIDRICLISNTARLARKLPRIGEKDSFADFARFYKVRNEEYTKRFTIGPVISEAQEAWFEGDYGRVVSLLSSISTELGLVEKARLRLAAKYLEHQGI